MGRFLTCRNEKPPKILGMACLLGTTVPAAWAPCVGQQRPLLAVSVVALRELRKERGPLGSLVSVPSDSHCSRLERAFSVFYFFREHTEAPRMDPTKCHAKALLELRFFSASVREGFSPSISRVWRMSAASLRVNCPYHSLITGPTLASPPRCRWLSLPKVSRYTGVRLCRAD